MELSCPDSAIRIGCHSNLQGPLVEEQSISYTKYSNPEIPKQITAMRPEINAIFVLKLRFFVISE